MIGNEKLSHQVIIKVVSEQSLAVTAAADATATGGLRLRNLIILLSIGSS